MPVSCPKDSAQPMLKAEKLKVERWRDSLQVRAQVRTLIKQNMWYLPEQAYPDEEVENRTQSVYQHIYSNYFGGEKNNVYQR